MNTIQMNLFDYFYENESFTTKEATLVCEEWYLDCGVCP